MHTTPVRVYWSVLRNSEGQVQFYKPDEVSFYAGSPYSEHRDSLVASRLSHTIATLR